MANYKVLFGKRVRSLRKAKDMTQAQLAEKLSLSINYISQIETGEASPTFKTIVKLAEGLDVELVSLFDFGTIEEGERE